MSTGLHNLKGCCRHQHTLQPRTGGSREENGPEVTGSGLERKEPFRNLAECRLLRGAIRLSPLSTLQMKTRPLSLFKNE